MILRRFLWGDAMNNKENTINNNKLSIVVPIYNEYDNVKKIVEQLDRQNGNFEVIFVDGSPQPQIDMLKTIIEPKYSYMISSKGRGHQMNMGYEVTSGDVVLFLHADSIIEDNMVTSIIDAVNSGVEFGCLSIYFEDSRPIFRVCGFMSRFRARRRKIAFGDQGMFFRRGVFEDLDKFKEIPIMEDYDISIRAKGNYRLVQIKSRIGTSTRRYYIGKGIFNHFPLVDIGIMMVMWDMQVYQKAFRDGNSPSDIVKNYYK